MRLTELVTPLKPLEAMAQGLLLLASDVGGHQELIKHGETGFLFHANDPDSLQQQIQRIFNAPDQAHTIKRQARQFIMEHRQWDHSVRNYVSTYENALKSVGKTLSS